MSITNIVGLPLAVVLVGYLILALVVSEEF